MSNLLSIIFLRFKASNREGFVGISLETPQILAFNCNNQKVNQEP